MGSKYTTQSVSGYNSTPPPDDGTVSEANKTKYSTIKTKLGDPLNTAVAAIDSALTTHFDRGPTAITTATTLNATHYQKIIEASGTSEITLTDAATLTAGWFVDIFNKGSGTIPILRATASDTIDETSNDISLYPLDKIRVYVNAGADGFITDRGGPLKDYYADSGAADAYVATPYPAWQAYAAGDKIALKIANANTGASTLNVSGLGTKNIKLQDGNDPAANQIQGINTFQYDGTNFVLLDPFGGSASSGASLVLLQSQTASSSATIDFTSTYVNSTYDQYFVTLTNVDAATTGTDLFVRLSQSGTFITGSNYYWAANEVTQAGTRTGLGGSAASEISLCNSIDNSNTRSSLSGIIYFAGPSDTTYEKHFWGQTSYESSAGNFVLRNFAGTHTDATAMDGIRFLMSSGNINSGTFRLYGIKNS